MLSKRGGNVAARGAVLSAYKTILGSLKRGCTGVEARHKVIKGVVIDGASSTREGKSNSVLLKLPTIATGYVSPYWRQIVQDEFRLGSVVGDASSSKLVSERQLLKDRRKLARDYAELLEEIAQHEKLLMDFGWGAVRDSREELHNVARRCGLEVDFNRPEHQQGDSLPQPANQIFSEGAAEEQKEEEEEGGLPAFRDTEADPLEPTLRKINHYYSQDSK
eukprot:TRINITY_DN7786_c0_g1_i1.p2 TRINITY_DN7786_c0_g1~~TRINITY_DN7786_c0_g1_i1.p2  ORF type:complete len:220 (-),score=53.99 TRINITY_DN7786_c0_g1_i1:881-1540(-)